jgi:hypothetical protein
MITVECLNNLWMLLQREALAPELACAKREIELLRIEVCMIMMVWYALLYYDNVIVFGISLIYTSSYGEI